MALILKKVERPRELKWHQAAAMLYGDWGTSKAYVLGIAFAIAGHASLFFLFAMNVLVLMVGFCYVIVCKAYPDGGGVYSAVRQRSRTFAVIGALLLAADYVITAALSGVEAFHYFGFAHPQWWAIGTIAVIGLINVVGPTRSSDIASAIAIIAALCLAALSVSVLPHLGNFSINVPEGGFSTNWTKFVGIVLALSGVEAIANVTGIMVQPVEKTARRAILPVMFEVVVISMVLGVAMNSIPGLTGHTEDMIRVIGEYYVGPWFGKLIAIVLGFLLLSAANTAIMGLISVLFLMSKDKELPPVFSSLNRYGMPWFGLLVAALAPIIVLALDHNVTHLAALYAIGVVGAIAINLGACCINSELRIKKRERILLGAAAIIMICVEATIIHEKPNAVIFASCVLALGLSARTIAQRMEKRRKLSPEVLGINVLTIEEARDLMPLYHGSTLVAVKSVNASLVAEAALHAKGKGEQVVYTLFVEEKPPGWAYPTEVEPSMGAVQILQQTLQQFEEKGITAVPLWSLAENPGQTIVKTMKDLDLQTIMIGSTRRSPVEKLLKGEVFKTITAELPPDKHLVICN